MFITLLYHLHLIRPRLPPLKTGHNKLPPEILTALRSGRPLPPEYHRLVTQIEDQQRAKHTELYRRIQATARLRNLLWDLIIFLATVVVLLAYVLHIVWGALAELIEEKRRWKATPCLCDQPVVRVEGAEWEGWAFAALRGVVNGAVAMLAVVYTWR